MGSFRVCPPTKFKFLPQNLLGPTMLFLLPPAPEIILKQNSKLDSTFRLPSFLPPTFNINVIFSTIWSHHSSCSCSCGIDLVCGSNIITNGVFRATKSSFLADTCVVAVMITKSIVFFFKCLNKLKTLLCVS